MLKERKDDEMIINYRINYSNDNAEQVKNKQTK